MRALSDRVWNTAAQVQVPGGFCLYTPVEVEQLRVLRHLMLIDLRATRRFERWLCKFPKHRIGPRPECLGTKAGDYQKVCQEYVLASTVWECQWPVRYGSLPWPQQPSAGTILGAVMPRVWKCWFEKYTSRPRSPFRDARP